MTWRFYPSTKGPLGWFAWRSDTDDADQRADLGTTVTHQEMRARGKVATYDPMAQLRSAASQEQLREVEELVVRALKKRGTYSAALIDAALVQLGAEERTRMHPSGAPGRRGACQARLAQAGPPASQAPSQTQQRICLTMTVIQGESEGNSDSDCR